ncbi:MAG: hypothetical protein ACLR8P_06700 [Clostridium fessum]
MTDSEETAKRLIDHLKKNRYGRATFLPLTSMERRQSFGQPGALKEMGVLGLASELVSADEKYSGLVSYLLGRVVVVDQIDHAIALAKEIPLFSPDRDAGWRAFKPWRFDDRWCIQEQQQSAGTPP